jgi:hypothetical protein
MADAWGGAFGTPSAWGDSFGTDGGGGANCGLLLNDGTSFVLLNTGDFVLLNDNTCLAEPGGGGEPAVDSSGPGAGRYMATTFTRKRWKEMEQAWAAQKAAEARSLEVNSGPKRRQLQKATKLAEHALLIAEAENELRVTKLKVALQAAADAGTLTKALIHAKQAQEIAEAMIEDIEDEESTIIMLLSGW